MKKSWFRRSWAEGRAEGSRHKQIETKAWARGDQFGKEEARGVDAASGSRRPASMGFLSTR